MGWDLLLVVVVARSDGVLELSESLAQSATRVWETLGTKKDERGDEQDDQVGGL